MPLAKSRGLVAYDFSAKTTRFPCLTCQSLNVIDKLDCSECNGLGVSTEVTNISFKGLSFKDSVSSSTSLSSLLSFFSFIPLFSQYLKLLNDLDNIFSISIFLNSKDKLVQYPIGAKLSILSFNDFFIFYFIKNWPNIIKKKPDDVFDGFLEGYIDNLMQYLKTELGSDKVLISNNKKPFIT